MANSGQRVQRSAPSDAAVPPVTSRQAILDAARELFSDRGYTATSIADIVARSGSSVGLPYYHFGSKKDIFLTLWNEYQASQAAHTRAAVAEARRQGATGLDLLLVGTRAYLEGAWRTRNILPMIHSRDTPGGFDAVIRDADRRWERQNRALLSEYDPQLVRTAVVMVEGALGAVCLKLPKCRTDTEADQLIDSALLLFAGLLSGLAP